MPLPRKLKKLGLARPGEDTVKVGAYYLRCGPLHTAVSCPGPKKANAETITHSHNTFLLTHLSPNMGNKRN